MHPDDAADLVALEVDDLRARATLLPAEDAIAQVDFIDRFQVYLTLRVRRWSSAPAPTSSPIHLPNGARPTALANIPIVGSSAIRALVLHADCTDFDGQPPLVEVVDEQRVPLSAAAWPRDPAGRGIVTNHRVYGRPFFCRPGTREYHAHPQHEDDPWDRHREGMTLGSILLPIVHDLHHRWIV